MQPVKLLTTVPYRCDLVHVHRGIVLFNSVCQHHSSLFFLAGEESHRRHFVVILMSIQT